MRGCHAATGMPSHRRAIRHPPPIRVTMGHHHRGPAMRESESDAKRQGVPSVVAPGRCCRALAAAGLTGLGFAGARARAPAERRPRPPLAARPRTALAATPREWLHDFSMDSLQPAGADLQPAVLTRVRRRLRAGHGDDVRPLPRPLEGDAPEAQAHPPGRVHGSARAGNAIAARTGRSCSRDNRAVGARSTSSPAPRPARPTIRPAALPSRGRTLRSGRGPQTRAWRVTRSKLRGLLGPAGTHATGRGAT